MSFKREGNDAGLLETLRKRRINELLSEEIPDDEAKLLCNGRFTCTVCPSNPVFDTVNVLSIHRRGKKHLSNLEVYVAKKRELKQLIAARKHQQYLKDGTTAIKMAVPVERGIITSCPYDPRVKKSKVKQGERRPILEIGVNRGVTSASQSFHQKSPASAVAGSVNSGTCGFSVLRNTYAQSVSGPIMHDHQLKNIFSNKFEEPVRITPYQSKFRKNRVPVQQSINRTSLIKELPCTTVPQISALRNKLHTGVTTTPPPPITSTNSFGCTPAVPGVAVASGKSLLPPPPPPVTSTNNFGCTPAVPSVAVASGKSLLPPPPPPTTSTNNCNRTPAVLSVAVTSGKSLLPAPPPPPTTSTNNCNRTPAVPNVAVTSGKSLLPPPPPPPPPTTSTNNCNRTPAVLSVAVTSGKSLLPAPPPPPTTSTNNCNRTPAVPNVAVTSGKSLLPPPPPPPPPTTSTNNCNRTPAVLSVAVTSGKSLLPEASGDLKDQSCVSEKLRRLQGSGWKRDWDGKWIKDENAEFDSDEEAPDIP